MILHTAALLSRAVGFPSGRIVSAAVRLSWSSHGARLHAAVVKEQTNGFSRHAANAGVFIMGKLLKRSSLTGAKPNRDRVAESIEQNGANLPRCVSHTTSMRHARPAYNLSGEVYGVALNTS
jgi:hypothetical protein